MNEKEKTALGMLYDANYDLELIEARKKTQGICYEYNHLHPSNMKERNHIIRSLLGKTKERFTIEQPIYFDYGYHIEIGEDFYANYNLTILDGAQVIFWRSCIYCSQLWFLYSWTSK